MKYFEVKKSDFRCWKFKSESGLKNIKANAIKKLESLPDCFNINGEWHINELIDDGAIKPRIKYIADITI